MISIPEDCIDHITGKIKWFKIYRKRFWTKVDKNGPIIPHMKTRCWVWTSGKFYDKYGAYRTKKLKKKLWKAHRFAWRITNGKIPIGIMICHHCDNHPCVRPSHLFSGKDQDNKDDMVSKGRSASGDRNGSRLYPERRQRGEEHWKAVLKEKQVIEIIRRLKKERVVDLAKEYNVKYYVISDINTGRRWRHIERI